MEWLKGLYIAATIFGAGVTLADVFGMLSNIGSSEGDGDGDGDGDDDFEDSDGLDDDSSGADESDMGSESAESDGSEDADGSIAGHDRRIKRNPVLTILTALRTVVYFSLGFGPVGWFAFTQYSSAETTLLWSLPTGIFVAIGTRMLRSFMKKELSSTITKTDLLMEKGEVTVSISEGGTGRVRVTIGGVYVDRYAKASDRSSSIPIGSPVRVVDADDEYVYVESESVIEEK